MNDDQLARFTVLADTVIVGSRILAECHHPAGTKSISPALSTHRTPWARANSGKRSRSGWSTSLTADLFESSSVRGYRYSPWSGEYITYSFDPKICIRKACVWRLS